MRANSGDQSLTATVLRDAPSRRFVRFARRPVVTRAKSRSFWRSVAATSRAFSPEIRPLDRRFLRSVTISFRGANFVSLYLLYRSSVWRATSSCAKLDSVASVGPPIHISCSGYRGE
ncbi:formin-like protein 6 [Iris pallida]|uniref:Formin-like protein 6 n=1 Tax=Iris pallida TaxID=29817 RepID=A0AAX6DH50_IRIPA|nr:formin-like protein 6 [Iris pallida]